MNNIYNTTVQIRRRVDTSVASRDALNNPVYGAPTSSWTQVYDTMPCKFAFTSKQMTFVETGERIQPTGVMYFPADYSLFQNDRAITLDGIEYVITDIAPAYLYGSKISHFEANVKLP